MAFYPYSGNWTYKTFKKKASTAFTPNTLVAEDSDDIVPADASATAVIGIVLKEVTSADSDYASDTRILVAIPEDRSSLFIGDVTTGTIATANENALIDLTDAAGADATASTTDILKIRGVITSTKGIFSLNKPTIV